MEKALLENEFIKRMHGLIGEPLWGFVGGMGTGSVVSLSFGEKIPRKRILSNPHLSMNARQYDGSLELFIMCVWRIDSASEVICGGWSGNKKGEEMLMGLERLCGQKVEEIIIIQPSFDFELRFSNSLWLKVFCDQTNVSEMYDNYSLFTQDIIYTVATKSILETSLRDD